MRLNSEKKQRILSRTEEILSQTPVGKMGIAEGTFILLQDFRDLMIEQNELLRKNGQVSNVNITDNETTIPKKQSSRWTFWKKN